MSGGTSSPFISLAPIVACWISIYLDGHEIPSIIVTREQLENGDDCENKDERFFEAVLHELDHVITPEDYHIQPRLGHSPSFKFHVVGPDNVPGYDKVMNLAEFLVEKKNKKKKKKNIMEVWGTTKNFTPGGEHHQVSK